MQHTTYDVFPDGRLLMFKRPTEGPRAAEVIAVFNWLEEVRQKMQAK